MPSAVDRAPSRPEPHVSVLSVAGWPANAIVERYGLFALAGTERTLDARYRPSADAQGAPRVTRRDSGRGRWRLRSPMRIGCGSPASLSHPRPFSPETLSQ